MRSPPVGPSVAPLVLTLITISLGFALWRQRRSRAAHLQWPELGLAVNTSTIPGAGLGLFAMRDFESGAVVAAYYGEVLSFARMALRENREYIMGGFGMNAFVDAAQQLDCPARYINDCFDASKLNARFVKDPALRRATAVATRAVRAGEEILASYGEDYWLARGVDPATGLAAEPDDETKEGLRLLEAARARAKSTQTVDGR